MKTYCGLVLLLSTISGSALASPLSLQVYNPQHHGMFPVSSVLVSGPEHAILFDAQFSTQDGEKLVQMIRQGGKPLQMIVITAGDPDFYFGLEPLVNAFPGVKVVASPNVVAHIRATRKAKLAFWGPQMKDGAPQRTIVPEALTRSTITLDGNTIELRRSNSYAAYVWIPESKTILGGTAVSSGIHVWTADTQSRKQRSEWRHILTEMQHLHPRQVIPGHYLGQRPAGDQAVTFTLRYLQDFEHVLAANKQAAEVTRVMKAHWPTLEDDSALALSAKVNSGEMRWP
ncbi:MBL fold metallo-hydrolase [Shimwellia pseudoproteus]|uniref:Vmh family MBL fold metallo-hydrolase n=1 Tax=Shimwellia pseudoproteus TaxID=570012 RepID=UPI0018EDA775|nr:Vmh family MBL fold metallo-hydrolase [Shimwellia pseudoproteus]MBJ3813517.1 MBL fold metallo-hydrolase [Shimwellia pseudoproteus]